MDKLKYLSLFSGIGGFEYGLEQSRYEFENVGFSEIDGYAKSIYTRWFPRHKDLGDATEIDPKGLQDFDLLVGGFPCQDMTLITLYCYVIGVIIGSIPTKIDISCLEKIEFDITTGWTEFGKDGERISDTQRYKCLGNAVTTTVVTYIVNNMFGTSDGEES